MAKTKAELTQRLRENVLASVRTDLNKKQYEKALAKFQIELVKLQKWIHDENLKVVVICEGRDAAGKGGAIRRMTQSLNPRICRVVALGTPTEREKTQWYFQRYVAHLPAAGEMVLFDRSWYNRAGVERVMGFCTEEEYGEFMRSCPEFERMLVRSGITLIKYWFSVSDAEQELRFKQRIKDPIRRWKISDMDLLSRKKWVDYSIAKDEMFKYTDIKQAPWYVVEGDDKKRARLNVIAHLLSLLPYTELKEPKLKLPPRQIDAGYVRPPIGDQTFVPEVFQYSGEGPLSADRGSGWTGQLNDMQSGVGPIDEINQAPIVDVNVVGLNCSLALFDAVDRGTTLIGIGCRRGNVIPHFPRLERVSHVDNPHTRVEPRQRLHLLVERRRHRRLRSVWAEAPSPITETTRRFLHLKCGDRPRMGFISDVNKRHDMPRLLTLIRR